MYIAKVNRLIRDHEYGHALKILIEAISKNGMIPVYDYKAREILELSPSLKDMFNAFRYSLSNTVHLKVEEREDKNLWLDKFFGFYCDSDEQLPLSCDPQAQEEVRSIKDSCSPCAVIPSYNDYKLLRPCIESLLMHASDLLACIVISDDCSQDYCHITYLDEIEELGSITSIPIYVCRGDENKGFSANVNRGIRKAEELCGRPDILLLNSDTEALENGIQKMATVSRAYCAIVGARLLYPDRTIQHGGGFRNFNHPDWFDHVFRGLSHSDLRTSCQSLRLYCTGAALYIPHEAKVRIGLFDEMFKMGFEDVDYCLRAWDCGISVMYSGAATLIHHESQTRGLTMGERERLSKDYFWVKHKYRFGPRRVENGDGVVNVIFVLQDTGVGGGHRVVFMFANELARNGFRVSIFSLASPPMWFGLDKSIEFRSFPDYRELTVSLAPLNAIKVATWWETAAPVWEASLANGFPVWLSQDIESSYYKEDIHQKINVLAAYRPEFTYIVVNKWIQRIYQEKFFYHSHYVGLGVDHESFYLDSSIEREKKTVLFCARSEPLKGFDLMRSCIPALLAEGYHLIAFGVEHDLVAAWPEIEFHLKPADHDLRCLYARAEIFLQTSVHEGFSLPPLEAMACGAIAVMTNATGNMDYARHMQNAIIVDRSVEDIIGAIKLLLHDELLRKALFKESLSTAFEYRWTEPLSRLIKLFEAVSKSPIYGLQTHDSAG